jgi:uncharacterized membrane protein
MQCPVCHNEVASMSGFCPHCGANLAAAAAAAAAAPAAYAPPPAGYPPVQPAAASGLSPNSAAAIAYLTFIPAVLFLILEPYNKIPLVRFHSMQSIALNIVWFVLSCIVAVVSMFVAFIPGLRLMFFLFPMIHFGLFAVMFIVWLIAILKASKGEFYKLPIIGDFAMKQAQS